MSYYKQAMAERSQQNGRKNCFIRRAHARLSLFVRRVDFTPLLLIFGAAVLYAVLCAICQRDAIGASGYNTYTLQALAWREGRMSLGRDYPHLELAIWGNDWWVSFPPVPSIPLYFLSFFFGSNTPDHLLVKLYVLFGCLFAYGMLRRARYDKLSAAAFSLLCSHATGLIALSMEGAVWFQAQTMAFMLTMGSLYFMYRGVYTPSLFLYALAVGCRPFNAVYGLVLFVMWLERALKEKRSMKREILRLIPGVTLGLCVAFAYGWYNYVRFGNPLEFGHNHLPEFSFQGGVQFSLHHVMNNIRTFLLGAPFSYTDAGYEINKFGFSMFIVHPVFVVMLLLFIVDLCRKRLSFTKAAIIVAFAAQLFCLLLHRTFGGYQFGARYTCDLLPYAALYFALPGRIRRMTIPEALLLMASLGFAIYGACTVLL
ncbi:MAG: hypothetical protein IJA59_02275 [Clostridia bacterium]|nr:hypothetical protein [Clostridia bacterium]